MEESWAKKGQHRWAWEVDSHLHITPHADPITDAHAAIGYGFDPIGTYSTLVTFGFPSEQSTGDVNLWPSSQTDLETVTSVTSYTLNSNGLPQSDTTTLGYHNEAQSLDQASATVYPSVPVISSGQSTINELTDASTPKAIPMLNTAVVEGIDESVQEDLQDSFVDPALNSDFTQKVSPDTQRIEGHNHVAHSELQVCNQCQTAFRNIASLGKHASETGHASFFCPEEGCGKAYSRSDVLRRHQDTHRLDVTRYPCSYCRRHRGANGFKRQDHLTQHLRNYHNIGVDSVLGNSRSCPHRDCLEWRPEGTERGSHAFQKSSDYIAHMRKVHKESEFPCTEPGCDRTGSKGYFRMRDFQKHKLKEHGIPIE